MKYFYTADNHFCHTNIIKYCNRPFYSVQEMDKEMVIRWNYRVAPDDVVYHLGDFALASASRIADLLRVLNGHKILLRGNHDRGVQRMINLGFQCAGVSLSTEIEGTWVDMAHHPGHFQDKEQGGIILCGHVHEKWKRKDGVVNVGVDVWDFAPVTLEEIQNELY